jgi:hypothetical protein
MKEIKVAWQAARKERQESERRIGDKLRERDEDSKTPSTKRKEAELRLDWYLVLQI